MLTAGAATFGALNNLTNAVYYNYISDGESDLTSSSHVDKHINRWDRLDYVKSQGDTPSIYTPEVRMYYAEYDVHVVGWRALEWADGKNIDPFSSFANRAKDAYVEAGQRDKSDVWIFLGTLIFEFLGL